VETERLAFLGATAFPEISEIVRDINRQRPRYAIEAILDDNPNLHGTRIEDTPVLGPLERVHQLSDMKFVFGIGSFRNRLARYDILRRLALPRERFATLVHPAAKVYSTATVGHGCILFSGCVIANGAVVEDFGQVLCNSVVGAYSRICEGALVAALVTITAHVTVGPFAHLGGGSVVGNGVKIGPGAQVALGSVAVRDVPPGVFLFGNPPRLLERVDVPAELLERWRAMESQGPGVTAEQPGSGFVGEPPE